MTHRKSLSLNWRRIPERYQLLGNECATCGAVFFPPRALCSKCRRKGTLEDKKLGGLGEVFTFTAVRSPPEGFEHQIPYVLAIVKLKEGPFITGMVTDVEPQEVSIGMPVRSVFRRISEDGKHGVINYAFKFVRA
ncbi:Zn-ribbon domain-containing OB-fold protein [Candidatus Micrarchaeota archaeon]|nr:Zn-ribbon domain-containing OB-fold protein [Candidatus Micrarchaeota archaeon]